jgi:hypothetical protein
MFENVLVCLDTSSAAEKIFSCVVDEAQACGLDSALDIVLTVIT